MPLLQRRDVFVFACSQTSHIYVLRSRLDFCKMAKLISANLQVVVHFHLCECILRHDAVFDVSGLPFCALINVNQC